jgi:integrase
MNFEKLNEFRYLRDMSIIWLARNSKISVQKILQKKMSDFDELNKYFVNDLLTAYKDSREQIATDETWLFTTDEGRLYMPRKFSQNVQRLLEQADMPIRPSHPTQMSQAQIEALADLRFGYHRPVYQYAIASGLIGYQGMRPEEVASLFKKDIDEDNNIITLEKTKSQEPQYVVIQPDLREPIKKFLAWLDPSEPLFIRSTGRQWNRKDVYVAVEKIANQVGLSGLTPRRLRATFGHELLFGGAQINEVSLLLRHSDEATTARHYLPLREINDARRVINRFRPTKSIE